MPPCRTVLTEAQRAAGGRLVDFHGWEMPVQFRGILEEHQAVRTGCGVFDLGHMGRLHLRGAQALAFLEGEVTRDLSDMKPGQVRYGLVLEDDGGVVDDILVSREGADAFHVVVNASNLETVRERWRSRKPVDGVDLRDLSDEQAMIAVQGPRAADLLSGLGLDGRDLGYYRFADRSGVRLSRTGYTGEDGFEILLPAQAAEALWKQVVAAGATPCGLGCRDTLRLEAGMPLYGHELDRAHDPLQAGLGFAVSRRKTFAGSQALERRRLSAKERLVGLRGDGNRVARHGYPVVSDGRTVGLVTSGTLSPTLGLPIAMAWVDAALAKPGTALGVDIRGKSVEPFTVVELPFYRRQG